MSELAVDELVVQALERLTLSSDQAAQLEAASTGSLHEVEAEREQRARERNNRRTNLRRSLDYLVENKLTLLRDGAYDAAGLAAEVRRLEKELADIDDQERAEEAVAPAQMAQEVLGIIELVNLAKLTYKYATPEQKRDLLIWAVIELVLSGGSLAKVSPREGFAELEKVGGPRMCAPNFVIVELPRLYAAVKKIPPPPAFLLSKTSPGA